MKEPGAWLVTLAVLLATSACFKDGGMLEPPSMALQVGKQDAREYEISFAAQVANWDGASPITYQASACFPSGEHFLCFGSPFFETSVVSDRIVQPISWTPEECGMLLLFKASLPNGDTGEVSHVTCS